MPSSLDIIKVEVEKKSFANTRNNSVISNERGISLQAVEDCIVIG